MRLVLLVNDKIGAAISVSVIPSVFRRTSSFLAFLNVDFMHDIKDEKTKTQIYK